MNWRTVGIGAALLLLLIILIFAVRGCGPSEPRTLASDVTHLTSCTPDRETGICNPQDKNLDFNRDVFMSMVYAHQRRSSASSSSSSESSSSSVSSGTRSTVAQSGSGYRDWSHPGTPTSEGVAGGGGTWFANDGAGSGSTLQGSVGPLPSGKCLRSRSLLALFDFGDLTTGTDPVTFPVLIDGDCPITAAMIRVRNDGFGGPLDDF